MLMNEPFEALVKQDTEMVQEIRVSFAHKLHLSCLILLHGRNFLSGFAPACC